MVGIDLVYIPEFQKQMNLGGEAFLKKAFNNSELTNLQPEHLAGIWAAKEAVIKASASKVKRMADITVSYDDRGNPKVLLGTIKFDISVAHHGEYAVAVAQRVNK